jgi:exonuclease SbcD
MRILHTADWHIGHRLYERNRVGEHKQFLDWLLETIKEHEIDVLLVSGDVFDTALPASEVTNLYYQFLFRLYHETSAHAVITAGNHDSPQRLAAPREFLKMGRIHVVGSIDSGLDECVITLQVGTEQLSVAAIPYLAESEILPHVSFEGEIEKATRYREAIRQLYHQCVAQMPADSRKVLMGHLVVQGGEESGSERQILIGGALPVRASDLPAEVDYVALGHLHRPQKIRGADYPIQYSGSPLPMTFQESTYDKKVCVLDFARSGDERVTELTVPTFKELRRVSGKPEQVMVEAMMGDWDGKYIEVQLTLDTPQLGVGDEIREAFKTRGGDVLLVEVQLAEQKHEAEFSAEDISAKSPEEIFEAFYRTTYGTEDAEEADFTELMETFKELEQIVSTQTEEQTS